MKVLVLGSGVIGVARLSAGRRWPRGDRDRPPARGRRWKPAIANAGEVSPGYSAPWAGPGVPLKAVKWLLMQHRPLVIRPHLDLRLVRWGLAMLRNCTAARYEVNKGRMVRLAEYSRDCLVALRAARPASTTTSACRARCSCSAPRRSSTAPRRTSRSSSATAWRTSCSTATAASRHEPALARRAREVRRRPAPARRRDRRLLQVHATALAALAATRGVQFRYGVDDPLACDRRRADRRASRPTRADFEADAYLVALGSYSPHAAGAAGHPRSRSIRSRATRSPCRSPMPPARPSRR